MDNEFEPGNPDNDVQITIYFKDQPEQTFTILRDSNMRWQGALPAGVITKIEAIWFHNPAKVLTEEEVLENDDGN